MKTQGHEAPQLYPLCKLWNERVIARERVRNALADEVTLMQTAMTTIVSGKTSGLKKALKAYRDG